MEILLVSAVSWEIRPVLNVLRRRAMVAVGEDGAAKIAYGRVRLTALSLGVGARRAAPRFKIALETYRPERVLLAGFSGGVKQGQKVGDIALPTVFSRWEDGAESSGAQDGPLRSALAMHLKSKDIALLPENRALSVNAIAGPAQKQEIGRRWPDACGVDMESYALAEASRQAGIPFLCVRAIFDEAQEQLPSWQNFWRLPWWYFRASSNLAAAAMFVLEHKALPA